MKGLRMSLLKLYAADCGGTAVEDEAAEPVILSFPSRIMPRLSPSRPAVSRTHAVRHVALERARLRHENRACPECRFPIVEPVELDDALLNRRGKAIPGTATIVAFRCDRCDAEWPA
jgi:hypothetical protein